MNKVDVIKVLAEDKTFENEIKNKGENDLEVRIKILEKEVDTLKAIINLKEIELTSKDVIIKEVKQDNIKLAKQNRRFKTGCKGYVVISVIMSIKNDRLVCRKNRQNCEGNIPLVLESPNSKKILQKEKIKWNMY